MAANFVLIYTDADGDEAPGIRMTAATANVEIARITKDGFVETHGVATASRYFVHPESGERVDFIVTN